MSLLNTLPYSEYEKALKFSCDTCQELAKIAKLKTDYSRLPCPGEKLMLDLENVGYTLKRYQKLLQIFNSQEITQSSSSRLSKEITRPSIKVALLVANEIYKHQYKLKTPSKDCIEIGENLKKHDFIVVILKDVTSQELRKTVDNLLSVLPEESYVFIYLAGHGAEISGVRYIFGIEAGENGLRPHNMVSVNYMLNRIATKRPFLCVLLMDVCAGGVEIGSDKELFESLPKENFCSFDGNLIIVYSSSSNQPAYEQVEIECNTESVNSIKYLDTARHALASPAGSIYAQALNKRIALDASVSRVLTLVTKDLESGEKKQVPIVFERGHRKLHLSDPISSDREQFLEELKIVFSKGELKNYTFL